MMTSHLAESIRVATENLIAIRRQRQQKSSSMIPAHIDLMPDIVAFVVMGDADHCTDLPVRNRLEVVCHLDQPNAFPVRRV